MLKFPQSYPYFNKYGLLIKRAELNEVARRLLVDYNLEQLGVELAEALLISLPSAKSAEDLITLTIKLVRYRLKKGWYREKRPEEEELDPRLSYHDDLEQTVFNKLILESLLKGLTDSSILDRLDLGKVTKFLRED